MAKIKDILNGDLEYYFKTSREMLWHLKSKTEEFCRRDDLGNRTNDELVDFIVELYENMFNQLEYSEQ